MDLRLGFYRMCVKSWKTYKMGMGSRGFIVLISLQTLEFLVVMMK
jgi:hypothetical protein